MKLPGYPLCLWGLLLLNLCALGAAWVSQHVFDMQPCPWCILQRLVCFALALGASLGLCAVYSLQSTSSQSLSFGQPPLKKVALLGAALNIALALMGAAAALWQHFVAASQVSCDLTLADKIIAALQLDVAWPEMFLATASCADAAVKLLGLPYELWSLALFGLQAGVWWLLIQKMVAQGLFARR